MILSLSIAVVSSGCSKAATGETATASSTDIGTDSGPVPGSPTASATATLSSTTTITATETVMSTVTQFQTVVLTSTVTSTVLGTVTTTITTTATSTVTATGGATALAQGSFRAENCYLDGPASEAAGRKTWAKGTFHFSGSGLGWTQATFYSDGGCQKTVGDASHAILFSFAGSKGGLVSFRIDDQHSGQRYWLLATESGGSLRFAIDAQHGQGPYVSEPTEGQLRDSPGEISRHGVWFRAGP